MPVIGHERVRAALESGLPSVVLLRGPASVGKWTLANYLVDYHGLAAVDVRRVTKLSLAAGDPGDVRDLIRFSRTGPFGSRKAVLARLDGASREALNTLLKILEEPPPTICFLLMAAGPTLDTVASRAQVYRMGLLGRDDLYAILVAQGVPSEVASRGADLGRGQVRPATAGMRNDSSRAVVLSILRAVAAGDRDLLVAAVAGFEETRDGRELARSAMALLNRWLIEAATGRWAVFAETETFGLTADPTLAWRMMAALRFSGRGKFMVHGVLDSFVVANSGRRV